MEGVFQRIVLNGEEREISARREDESEEEMPDEITEDQVRSIWKLKSGKSSGVCGIQGELLKSGGEVTVKWLQEIYSMVWADRCGPKRLEKSCHCTYT